MHEGLHGGEHWKSANAVILFGNGGDLATNRRDEQAVTMLALHLLHNALVYISTLRMQRVLSEPAWATRLTPEDLRVPIGPGLMRQGITSNLELSQKRADTVMQFMIAQGVNPSLVSAHGFGEQDPVASNDTPQGRAQNRRVELTLAGSGT